MPLVLGNELASKLKMIQQVDAIWVLLCYLWLFICFAILPYNIFVKEKLTFSVSAV